MKTMCFPKMLSKLSSVAVVTACLLSGPIQKCHAVNYTYATLNVPGEVETEPTAIVGNTVYGSYLFNRAWSGFSETGGVYTTITVPGAFETNINGVSDGTIFGTYHVGSTALTGTYHGFTLTGGVLTTFDDPLAGSANLEGTHINGFSGGTVVGTYTDANSGKHGFTEKNGVYTTFDYPNATQTNLTGISGNIITGTYNTALGEYSYAFTETGGVFTSFNYPGALYTSPVISDSSNLIFGYYDSNTGLHGFTANNGAYTTFDDPLGTNGTLVSGVSGDGNTIIGNYFDAQFGYDGFIATIPEPTSLSLLGIAAIALLRRRQRS